MAVKEEKQMIAALLEYVNEIPFLPKMSYPGQKVRPEKHEKSPPSMMLQQLTGEKKIKEYTCGNYDAALPFALYVKIDGSDSKSRIDAIGLLNNIGEYFEQQEEEQKFPLMCGNVVHEIKMTAIPALMEREENGHEDYQAIFRLEYEVKKMEE